MRSSALAWVSLVLVACAGPSPGGSGPAGARPAEALLPVELGRVLWYRARTERTGGERDVALFAAHDDRYGAYLESLGLGERALRLWRTDEQVYVAAGGLLAEGCYAPCGEGVAPALDGERVSFSSPAGTFEAVVVERTCGDAVARHWFAPGTGLVRLELTRAGSPCLTLTLVEALRRDPLRGAELDRTTPDALWRTLAAAARRLDLGAVRALLTPTLVPRPPTDAVLDLEPPRHPRRRPTDHDVEVVRAVVAPLLDLPLGERLAWTVTGESAHARATLRPGVCEPAAPAEVEVTLARHGGEWQLAGVAPAQE